MFSLSTRFIIDKEEMTFRSSAVLNQGNATSVSRPAPTAETLEAAAAADSLPGVRDTPPAATADLGDTATSILNPDIPVGNLETKPARPGLIGLQGRDEANESGF
jgi:hypothetical protein